MEEGRARAATKRTVAVGPENPSPDATNAVSPFAWRGPVTETTRSEAGPVDPPPQPASRPKQDRITEETNERRAASDLKAIPPRRTARAGR